MSGDLVAKEAPSPHSENPFCAESGGPSGPVRVVTTIAEVRSQVAEARAKGLSVGLVPTMGALHEGHASLIRRARLENDLVIVSVFVNPTQFDDQHDLAAYPRSLEHDCQVAGRAGADLVFAPSGQEMYPDGFATWVEVQGLTDHLCGASRPGHFRGVCTVVAKLFAICTPDRAYFGEKDFQQLAVIRRMTRDLDLPVQIVGCPTVREADGLALSSRNTRLTKIEREQAPVLFAALQEAGRLVEGGERAAEVIIRRLTETVQKAPLAVIDYVQVVDAESLQPVQTLRGRCLLALAVRFGETRLIDSLVVEVP